MKTTFNKRFDDVYSFKTQEIRRINERNIRLEKILGDMKIDGEEFIQLSLEDSEVPENILSVLDDEITVEKYISEKERKILEKEALLEEGYLFIMNVYIHIYMTLHYLYAHLHALHLQTFNFVNRQIFA